MTSNFFIRATMPPRHREGKLQWESIVMPFSGNTRENDPRNNASRGSNYASVSSPKLIAAME